MDSQQVDDLPENPKVKANFLANMTFWYTLPVFQKGRVKTLEPSDLYKALKEHKSSYLGDEISTFWERQKAISNHKGGSPSLLKTMLNVFGWPFAKLGLILLCLEFCLRITQPLFLGGLLNYYMRPNANVWEAYFNAGALLVCCILNVLTQHAFMLQQMHLGMKMRISLISLIYRKALRLTQTALGTTTTGKIVNLLSNDVGRFDHALVGLHQLWVGPLEIVVVIIIIYYQIGLAALAGVCFLLAFIPLQTFIGKKTSTFRAKTAIRSDERIRLMNEIIQGIQVIKMYAWEKPFGKLVEAARRREINTIRYTSYLRAIMLSFNVFVTRFSIFISLIVYALLGGYISADQAFVVTAYYNILRQTMTVHFTRGITQLADIFVSTKRIQQFLMYEEIKVKLPVDDQVTLNGDTQTNISLTDDNTKLLNVDMKNLQSTQDLPKGSLILNNVKAKWNPEATEYTLDNVSCVVSPGELIVIIGPVGAGKSSLIQSILGELPLESGSIQMNGTVSYASQDLWLFGGTVQQNILFGKPLDGRRYKNVIRHCALEHDLKLLPFGDQTVVGDRGQSLSGGQKARISLARSVYQNAIIYLLDDPLSAVDTHVGRHLFESCIRNYLKNRTVILATHQLQFVQQADKIIVMEHGRISAIGTYSALKDLNLDFTNLLLENTLEEENMEVIDDSSDTASAKFSRQNSETSVNSVEKKEAKDYQGQIKEVSKQGSIGVNLYKKYFRSGGSLLFLFVTFLFCIGTQVLGSACDYFLSFWVNKETRMADTFKNLSEAPKLFVSNASRASNETVAHPEERNMLDVYIFTFLVGTTIVVTISRSFLAFDVCIQASKKLHDAMYHGISRATLYFFNTNPTGRILNRFSKDIGQVDESLPVVILEVIQIFLTLAGIVFVIILVNTWFIIPTIIMITLFYYLRSFYLKTSRNIKRMEGVTRSPIFSHLSASLMGLSTIRAFGAQEILSKEFDHLQDLHSSTFFTFLSTSRAFGFWLDCICVFYIATVTLSFFMLHEEQAGNVGLAITQALGMTGMVQWGMRQSAELENTMTAVERVVEYEGLDNEGELDSKQENKPPPDWPQNGHVKFKKLSLRYFPDSKSDLVLKELEFEILPKEKVGIVGRTGAGKSSIINALFRLAYYEGSVFIDSKDTKNLGLFDLRSKISIIPQDPVLFSGTLRYNLDPFDEFSDAKIWEALEQVELKQNISEQPLGLQSRVTEGGTNFSTGQRQLVCLARAILRENRILVLDEATANVDHQTDNVIQTTVRDKFKDCTVITIAHRLHTIIDSDKVLVMDAGKIVEHGPPYLLLTASEPGVFYDMVFQAGEITFNALLQAAKDAYDMQRNKCSNCI